jgi:hypothetical protein
MPIQTGQVSVGTTATRILGTNGNFGHVILQNNDNTDAVYIGGTGVTTSTGIALTKLEHHDFDIMPATELYAVSSKSGHILSYMLQQL